ncbi:methyltransferase domain-containing protein [Maribacter polysiphoniae]|uniref:Methyltransferase domain-containing protein n=1 Tax=Maribacter polysiphoniae TaxID=429344 RepID=A0A316DX10_9FLAO|nr:class I SAM-dependent methyltransferase [Maribacter polysiphoniae]MBD1262667.1 methyltransferase domain-containing protein [Maribacter polysiphoniae]PWK21133.1 methyltransferase family protein [Maribacter polysiphoniae]
MIESKVICPSCKKNSITDRYQTYWECSACGKQYSCVNGMPKLYDEDALAISDKGLRDKVYKYMAWFYNFWNPFFMLPVRPIKISVKYWVVYFLLVFTFISLMYNLIDWIAFRGIETFSIADILLLAALVIFVFIFAKQKRYAHLLWLAIPIKIIVSIRKFKPKKNIFSVHEDFLKEFLTSDKRIKMLDIASGSGQALARRGYMDLNADYTAVDLSAGMIVQGRDLMGKLKAPTDFILADATNLPFESDTFDICTNYGAFNGFSDTKSALKEMIRVTKKGGKILILDEREYKESTWLEHLYYKKVFACYNTLDGSPIDLDPEGLEDMQAHQVYEFIYVFAARKKM